MEDCMSMWPRKNPDTYRITKLNDMRVDMIRDIDKYAHIIDDLLEYWLKAEADYVKDVILKNLWNQEAWLYKLICDANPDMKKESESESSTVTCPECGREWDKVDVCPDCWYDFNSKDNNDA